jgi:anti-sigma factor RsiW
VHTEHFEYLLPDYLNNTLEESLRPFVESHLEECGACRVELENLSATFHSLGVYQAAPPADGYFATVLPRVRHRLEGKKRASFLAHPLVARFAVPLAAGAVMLVILLRVPFGERSSENEQNPLQPVVRGLETGALVDIILDQADRQSLTTQGVSETSALLAVPFLRGDHLLTSSAQLSFADEPILGSGMPESLDQLSDSDVDVLVAQLGERAIL